MNEHLNEDTCLDLLRGFLTAGERDRALEHAATCAACEKLFAQSAAREERVRARGALRVQPHGEITVEPYLQNEPAALEPAVPRETAGTVRPPGNPWRRFLKPAVAAAAVAAAAVALFVILPAKRHDSMSLLLHPMADLGEEVHLRSDSQTGQGEEIQKGIKAYLGGDLRGAVSLLGNAAATGQLDNLRRVYLGSAYARLGEYDQAVRVLETVPFISVPDPWGSEGRWTLYVACRALGRDQEAESILEELAREPGEFGDRAREVLNTD